MLHGEKKQNPALGRAWPHWSQLLSGKVWECELLGVGVMWTEEEGGLNELFLGVRVLSIWVVSFGFHVGFSAMLEMEPKTSYMLSKDASLKYLNTLLRLLSGCIPVGDYQQY